MPSNMSVFQPVSIQTFRFEVDPPTHRVRIVVDYTYPNENMLGKDDSQGGPQHTTAEVPGLGYDAESHTIVYQTNGTRTVCAQGEEHGKHIKVKNTGACTITAQEANHTQDDGWKVHPGNMLDTYFEVH